MTPAERFRALLGEATPGPWKLYDRGIGWEVHDQRNNNVNDEFRECFREHDARLICLLREIAEPLADYIEANENLRKRGTLGDGCTYENARDALWSTLTRAIERQEEK